MATMNPTSPDEPQAAQAEDEAGPPCVLSFNAGDASGASGLAADITTVAAMGGHCLPVTAAILIRDTAEIFGHHAVDDDVVAEQARSLLEDLTVGAIKVGFAGSVESLSAIAEIASDYPDVPLLAYMPDLSWLEDDEAEDYMGGFSELVLPQAALLAGSHGTLTRWLLPEWDGKRAPTARDLAAAAAKKGTGQILVTGVPLPDQFLENTLATPERLLFNARFERFDAGFIGAGETLSAAVTAMLANGADLPTAVSEALTFLDQALDAGFRPGMGSVIPDRFFWAQPEETTDASSSTPEPTISEHDQKL